MIMNRKTSRRIAPLLLLAGIALLCLPSTAPAEGSRAMRPRGERARQLRDYTPSQEVSSTADTSPPRVILLVPTQVEGPRFSATVEAGDESGVAAVTISLDGAIVAGRTDPPYRFELTAPRLPTRVKALATDIYGNTASAEAVVEGPVAPCACPEIYAPVCGVDGRTYANRCEARCAGVDILHDGPCEAKPCDGEDETCSEAQFCEFPAGTCGATGEMGSCRERPLVCPRHFEPVCGCDGKTYGNDCTRQAAGVSLAHPGSCEATGCGGPLGEGCAEGEFCELPAGTCDQTQPGMCVEQPEECVTGLWAPVCGCDGNTYGNDCERRAAGVSVRHVGPCAPEICGGIGGLPCPEGQICDMRDASCAIVDLAGECVPAPEACPKILDPVCSCRGVTYDNDCERLKAGDVLAHRGPCASGATCGGIAGIPCPEGETCDMRDPTCAAADLAGQCVPTPESCPRLWAPVCACDGQTYANDCERLRAGAVLAHLGECRVECGEPPAGWFTCAADEECAVVDGIGCCPCTMGGRQGAVRRDSAAALEHFRRQCCSDIACPAVVLCEPGLQAMCVDGLCGVRRPAD